MLETRFAPDSLLEGDGFEPSVPHQKGCMQAPRSPSLLIIRCGTKRARVRAFA